MHKPVCCLALSVTIHTEEPMPDLYKPLMTEEMSFEKQTAYAYACMHVQVTHRDTSNTNQGDSNQEDSQASNPGGKELPQHSGGQEGNESGRKRANHVGSQKFAIGIIPAVSLSLRATKHEAVRMTWHAQEKHDALCFSKNNKMTG